MNHFIFGIKASKQRAIKFFHYLLEDFNIAKGEWASNTDLDKLTENIFTESEGYSKKFIERAKEVFSSYFNFLEDGFYFYVQFDNSFKSDIGTAEEFIDEAENMLGFECYQFDEEDIEYSGDEDDKDLNKMVNSVLSSAFEDEEFEEDPEWLEDQKDSEAVFESLLEITLLESEYFDVNFTSTYSDYGVMTNNKGIVVEVRELVNEKGEVLRGPFEFHLTIIKSK